MCQALPPAPGVNRGCHCYMSLSVTVLRIHLLVSHVLPLL